MPVGPLWEDNGTSSRRIAGSGAPHRLNAPIVGMVPSADGGDYFMVGADGGVFTFGDAKFEASCPGIVGGPGTAVGMPIVEQWISGHDAQIK